MTSIKRVAWGGFALGGSIIGIILIIIIAILFWRRKKGGNGY
jgi:cbb3-type cytochrome oxidase subunit 3